MQRQDRAVPHLKLVRDERTSASIGDRKAPHDEQVARAVALMRERLDARWTVTALARQVGLSRPAFARRFLEATGMSPMRYLTTLRMERAAALLRSTSLGLAQVAEAVGYASEFAFNRAFKRHHHLPPGGFRRSARVARPEFRCAA